MASLDLQIEFGIRMHEYTGLGAFRCGKYGAAILKLAKRHELAAIELTNFGGHLIERRCDRIENQIKFECEQFGNIKSVEFSRDPRGHTVIIEFASGDKLPVPTE